MKPQNCSQALPNIANHFNSIKSVALQDLHCTAVYAGKPQSDPNEF